MKSVIAALSMILLATPVFSQCSDADKKALEAFDRAWGDATERGDRAAMASFVADTYQGFAPGGVLGKSESLDAAMRAAVQMRASGAGTSSRTYDSYAISCTPNTATIVHRTTIHSGSGGKDDVSYYRGVHFLERRGNGWVVVANANHPLDDAGVLGFMEQEWNDANRKHDTQWIERNYASDATEVLSRSGRIMSKADVIAATRDDKTSIQTLELSDLNIRTEGNTAVVTGINHLVGSDASGKPLDRRVSFTDVFIKRDGRWQVWATQATAIP